PRHRADELPEPPRVPPGPQHRHGHRRRQPQPDPRGNLARRAGQLKFIKIGQWYAGSQLRPGRRPGRGADDHVGGPQVHARLGQIAVEGVHDPGEMPFGFAWTDAEPSTLAREVINYQLRTISSSTPDNWSLPLVVCRDGEVMGIQELTGKDFPIVREVGTGS